MSQYAGAFTAAEEIVSCKVVQAKLVMGATLYVMGNSLCDVAVERKTIGSLFGDGGSGRQLRQMLRHDLHQLVAQHLPQLPPTSTVTEQIPNRFSLHCHVTQGAIHHHHDNPSFQGRGQILEICIWRPKLKLMFLVRELIRKW